MDHGVAIVRRRQILILGNAVNGFRPRIEAHQQTTFGQRFENDLHPFGRAQVQGLGGGQFSALYVVHQIRQTHHGFFGGESPVPTAEERQADQGDRGDGRRPVDANATLEGQLLHREVLLVGIGIRRRIGGPEARGQGKGLTKIHKDSPVASTEPPDDAQEPSESLGLLGAATLLGRVVAHIRDLVVADGHGDQVDVVASSAQVGIHHVGQHAKARRPQFARTRPAPFDVPLQGKALLDQVVDVVTQNGFVDRKILETTANKKSSAAPDQRTHREEVHVDAPGGVVRR